MRHTLEIHAARMRLRSCTEPLNALLRRPARTEQEAEAKAAAIREYWTQLRSDKELVYGPTPQGYRLPARANRFQ
jgi:hypothetical protein